MIRLLLLALGLAVFVYLVLQLGVHAVVDMLRRIGWAGLIVAAVGLAAMSVLTLKGT